LRRFLNFDLAVDHPHLAIIDGYGKLRLRGSTQSHSRQCNGKDRG
jgi:hypothetical protein